MLQHMGAENLGPLLYTLVRFIKPQSVLEVGAGYTTLFLLQALRSVSKPEWLTPLPRSRFNRS